MQQISQAAYWNGEVGERWAREQAALDALFTPLTEALFADAGLRPGAHVLDIGCGAGATALIAARAVGRSGRVLAADLSAPLLAVAKSRAAADDLGAVEFVEADAQRHDFGTAAFDLALSRFGVMFFDDSVAAFANLRRALRPDARVRFLCWQSVADNPWVAVPRDAALPHVPDEPPADPTGPGPFRFADRDVLRTVLSKAGFPHVSIEGVTRDLVLARAPDGSGETAGRMAASVAAELGPVSRLLRDREPPVRETALAAVAAALSTRAEDGIVRLGSACWLVSAG